MNKELKSISKLEKAGYKGTKVMSMIKAIESQEIFRHLRLVQQDEFCRIKNRYNKNGYLTQPYFSYLWNLYWNFVLNDFRYESSKSWTEISKIKKVEHKHIGLRLLDNMIEENKCVTCGKKTNKTYCSEKCYIDND